MSTVTARPMRPWMKTFVSLLLLFYSLSSFGICEFKPQVKKVISLSGSMTVLLKETGLLSDPKLKGISVFSPVSESEFKGKIYPGGLFLAQSTLSEFSDGIVFFDKSEQLKKILQTRRDITAVEVSTRGLLPLEVIEESIRLLSPYTLGCEEKFAQFKKTAALLQEKLLRKIPSVYVVFYLGSIQGTKAPELVMVNDGVVALLIKEKKIKTYPSPHAYVNWSAKVISEMPRETLHVGIHDPSMKNEKKIKRSSNWMTLSYPGSLVPGYSQLEAFMYWAETIF